jgi:transposase InsO family protein
MPWNIKSVIGERCQLVKALLRKDKSVVALCRYFGVSRKTAYKWRGRFLAGGRLGLRDRKRAPRRRPRRLSARWIGRLRWLRQRQPSWGPKKLRAHFLKGGWRPPSVRTIGRWLRRLKLTRPRRQRPRKICVMPARVRTRASRPNQVWTVDFKGWFRAGSGERCEPLTVRDLFSRYGLLARVLPRQQGARVQAEFTRLFRAQGLPERIRVDNGSPFGSKGPAGLARLSVWWLRLGIAVEFTRPGCPQDNGAHEQFHGVLKRETAQPAAWTRQGQQHRTTSWLRYYNQERPHEALGQRVPAVVHRKSGRKFPRRLPEWKYGAGLAVRRVRSNGEIRWAGRKRFIGEAFVGERIGLKRKRAGEHAVYLGQLLIGHLHERDAGAMRPVVYRPPERKAKKKKV